MSFTKEQAEEIFDMIDTQGDQVIVRQPSSSSPSGGSVEEGGESTISMGTTRGLIWFRADQ